MPEKIIRTGERVNLQLGDRIAFSVGIAFRREYGNREIKGFTKDGNPLVYFNGGPGFIVAPHEITKHYPKP